MHTRSVSLAGIIVAYLALSPETRAQEKLFIQAPAVFGPSVQVVDSVRKDCELEEKVGDWVFDGVSKKYPGAARVRKPAEAGNGRLLKLTIVSVFGVGGGAYSGAKSMTVQADLVQGGKVVASTTKSRSSGGGAFGGMKGTCAIFGRVAKALGADVAAWLPGAIKGK